MPRYFSGSDSNFLDFGTSGWSVGNSVTVSLWAWFAATAGGGQTIIAADEQYGLDLNPTGAWQMNLDGAGAVAFRTHANGSTAATTTVTGPVLQPGRWYYLVGQQGGGFTRIFVNGVKYEAAGSANLVTGGDPLRIGRASGATGQALNALIAHAAFWSADLTQGEILRLLRGALPSEVRRGNLLLWAPCDGAGLELDRSARALHGTQNGSVPPVRDPQAIDIVYGGYPWLPSAPPANYPAGSIPVSLLAATTVVYDPYLVPGYPAYPDFIAATTALFTPTISQSTIPPFIGPIATLFEHSVRRSSITLQERIDGTQVFTPYLARTLVNVVLPTIMGVAQEGLQLQASPGVWSGTEPITYAYQWRRCDAGGGACVDITGETGSTYIVRPADIGGTLRIRVTASNG
jgi:hypothetical protein